MLLDDGHQNVNGDRNPDLSFHRVLRCALEGFDAQRLFDPLEE
jgi:hypothetical protein